MKKYLILIFLCLTFIRSYSQPHIVASETYKFVRSEDKYGKKSTIGGFQYISVTIITPSFESEPQSSAWYTFDGVDGEWHKSPDFDWLGYRNGWYVYVYKSGSIRNYFSISRDLKKVKIQYNGVVQYYSHCE